MKRWSIDSNVKQGAAAGLPIVIGYIPVAMAFGILSRTTGLSLAESFMFSVFVFAGASQLMALNLLNAGAGIGEIILATLLMNFRHFLMSASLSTRIKGNIRKYVPVIAFAVTDEVFSVASFKKGEVNRKYLLTLQFVSYSSWVAGTALGYMVGQVLPEMLKDSMGIALYAMFAAILIPEAKKSLGICVLSLMSGGLNALISYVNVFPEGWNLIISIVSASAFGAFIFKDKGVSGGE